MNKGYKISGVIILIVIGLMFSIIYSLNTSEPESDPQLITYTEEKVKEYLIQEKDLSEGEILEIESIKKAKSSDFSASGYSVKVVFADEPEAIYYYQLTVEDKVEQSGYAGNAKKHKEIP
ncbi:DUF3139 domain-containing protein [Solibacillus sp. R5-41]|uniref:DUF3139 domain-containing protein n=1 Tax=Solibacillus sp. R5-41 TaxID=2048654 RepID=UPI0012FD3E70|nr:DUF3139 domain-containing protein [Solibacillus sp. R5-41]